MYVCYQFHTQPKHRTVGVPHAPSGNNTLVWNDSHVVLLGTIDRELLTEYLRGPLLAVEVHDRDRRMEGAVAPAVFGQEDRDEVLGTHAFCTGQSLPVCSVMDPFPVGVKSEH